MKTKQTGIACGGNWIMDHVKTITSWPREETLAYIVAEEASGGGSAHNVLVDIARFGLGIPLLGVGLVGDDADGRRLRGECARLGIDTTHLLAVPGAATSITDVMTVRGTGRRTFFHNRGANALLAPEHFRVGAIPCRIFNLGYVLLLDRLDEEDAEYGTRAARVLAAFRAAGVLTSIDVVSEESDRFPRIVTPALAQADYCIVNEIEAGRTTGRATRSGDRLDERAVEAAARDLLGRGVKRLAVVHAPEASFGVSTDGEAAWQRAHALPPGFIQGTAGAGDAFLAGMLVGIHEEWGLRRSLRFATAAAATCLRHPTTTQGVGTAEEIWRLAETLPLR